MKLISNQLPPQTKVRKRERPQVLEDETRPKKKPRVGAASREEVDPIDHWRKENTWPKHYFEQDDQTLEYLITSFEKDRWFERCRVPNMNPPLSKEQSASSLRRLESEFGSGVQSSTTSDKSTPYRNPGYDTELAKKGSFMDKDNDGPNKKSIDICRNLLERYQGVPAVSRFSDKFFESTCRRIRNRNEAKVVEKIVRLIVPSVEDLTDFGSEHLEVLVETVNEGWNTVTLLR